LRACLEACTTQDRYGIRAPHTGSGRAKQSARLCHGIGEKLKMPVVNATHVLAQFAA
tara:strand:+ start:707 stop:877 length:171 start_codon:yes stop_codon:yes gene_type:complete